MIIFSFISLFSFLVCFFVGSVVYFLSSKKTVHKIFFVLCLLNAYFSLCEFLYRQAGNADIAFFWAKATFFYPMVLGVVIHFIIDLAGWFKRYRNGWFWVMLYGPFVFFSLIHLSTNWIVSGMIKVSWGYAIIPENSSFMLNFYNFFLMTVGQITIIFSIIYYMRLKPGKRKIQAKFIVWAYFAPSVLAALTIGVLPAMGFKVPQLMSLGTALQEILIGYAIWRYDLLEINPVTAAMNIFSTMSDLLILTDPEGKIVTVNKAVLKTTGHDKTFFANRMVTDLLTGPVTQHFFNHNENWDKTQENENKAVIKAMSNIEGTLMAKNGKMIPASASVSILNEKDGSIAGYVLVARDVTELKKVEAEKEKLIADLKEALDNIKTLRGLLPICSQCKKIRDDNGYWNQIEDYIEKYSDALFSHSLCPKCGDALYGKENWYKKMKDKKK